MGAKVRTRSYLEEKSGLAYQTKRILDVTLAFGGLVILSPLLLVIALAILVDSGSPILFTQSRVGLRGKIFRIYKFRTMVVNAETTGAGLYIVDHDSRLTRIGNFLRRTSLDELPQLINVLIGDQSIVGPRAMLPILADKLNEQQYMRHSVRPGITGLAQVKGRNSLPWSKRVELDLYYIHHWSLWLDFSIVLQTVRVVLTSEGVLMNQAPQEVDDL